MGVELGNRLLKKKIVIRDRTKLIREKMSDVLQRSAFSI